MCPLAQIICNHCWRKLRILKRKHTQINCAAYYEQLKPTKSTKTRDMTWGDEGKPKD